MSTTLTKQNILELMGSEATDEEAQVMLDILTGLGAEDLWEVRGISDKRWAELIAETVMRVQKLRLIAEDNQTIKK